MNICNFCAEWCREWHHCLKSIFASTPFLRQTAERTEFFLALTLLFFWSEVNFHWVRKMWQILINWRNEIWDPVFSDNVSVRYDARDPVLLYKFNTQTFGVEEFWKMGYLARLGDVTGWYQPCLAKLLNWASLQKGPYCSCNRASSQLFPGEPKSPQITAWKISFRTLVQALYSCFAFSRYINLLSKHTRL